MVADLHHPPVQCSRIQKRAVAVAAERLADYFLAGSKKTPAIRSFLSSFPFFLFLGAGGRAKEATVAFKRIVTLAKEAEDSDRIPFLPFSSAAVCCHACDG